MLPSDIGNILTPFAKATRTIARLFIYFNPSKVLVIAPNEDERYHFAVKCILEGKEIVTVSPSIIQPYGKEHGSGVVTVPSLSESIKSAPYDLLLISEENLTSRFLKALGNMIDKLLTPKGVILINTNSKVKIANELRAALPSGFKIITSFTELTTRFYELPHGEVVCVARRS